MTTTSKTTAAKAAPALTISAGRAAAALECAKKADGYEFAATLLAKSIEKRSGNASLSIDKAQAIALAKAIMAGFDHANLPGQRRGAAKKALSALIEQFKLTKADVGIAEPKAAPAPAKKPAPKKATTAAPKATQ